MDNWNGFEQLTLTDIYGDGTTPLRINRKIRLLEMFAGYGSQAMALARLGADFEHYRAIEFDKHAMNLYNVAHGTNFEPTDIRNITGADLGIEDKDKYFYILTYSFPCQSLSVAGKMHGMAKGSGTRSGLLWEVERLLDTTSLLPDLLLMENVSQVHGKGNEKDFQLWIDYLSSKGYTSKWVDMNSRDFGIPQNRKRCFMLSWLGNYTYEFPKPIPLNVTMADYLEDEVDDKYYINSERAKKLIEKLIEDHIIDTEQNRTEQNRTEQNRTEQNRTEQNRTEQLLICPTKTQEQSTLQTQFPPVKTGEFPQEGRKARECVSINYKTVGGKITEAKTLMARDWKGFGAGHELSNGVVESKNSV